MNGNNKYSNCQYYPAGTNSGSPFRYESEAFLGHFCLPSGTYTNSTEMKEAFRNAFFNNVVGDKGTQYFYDIGKSWPVILVASICSVIIAYIFLFMIRYMGGVIIWVSVALSIVILVGAGIYSYLYARPQYATDDPTYEYLGYAAYVCWACAGLVVLTLICCMNAIQLGIAVFKTTVQYVQCNMEIFLLPLVSCILSGLWFVIWLTGAVYLFSVGEPTARDDFPFITEVKWSESTRGVIAYHAFALLWINAFIIGCVQFIIGASTCIWYFEC
jgi:choline transporter-like protein 2/4/5